MEQSELERTEVNGVEQSLQNLRDRTEMNGVQQSLQNLRDALNAIAENNNSCLARLQLLRERFQADTSWLFAYSNNRNSRLDRLRTALNIEIEALTSMEVQFMNTSSTIERLRDEFTIYRRQQNSRQLVSEAPAELAPTDFEIFLLREGAAPQTSSSSSSVPRQEQELFPDPSNNPIDRDINETITDASAATNSTRHNGPLSETNRNRGSLRRGRRRLATDSNEHEGEPPQLRRRRDGRFMLHPRFSGNTRTWMEIHGKFEIHFNLTEYFIQEEEEEFFLLRRDIYTLEIVYRSF